MYSLWQGISHGTIIFYLMTWPWNLTYLSQGTVIFDLDLEVWHTFEKLQPCLLFSDGCCWRASLSSNNFDNLFSIFIVLSHILQCLCDYFRHIKVISIYKATHFFRPLCTLLRSEEYSTSCDGLQRSQEGRVLYQISQYQGGCVSVSLL